MLQKLIFFSASHVMSGRPALWVQWYTNAGPLQVFILPISFVSPHCVGIWPFGCTGVVGQQSHQKMAILAIFTLARKSQSVIRMFYNRGHPAMSAWITTLLLYVSLLIAIHSLPSDLLYHQSFPPLKKLQIRHAG